MQKALVFLAGLVFSLVAGTFSISFFGHTSLPVNPVVDTGQVVAQEIASPPPILAPITIESVFDSEQFDYSSSDLVLYATGDLIPARVTDSKIRTKGGDYPFEKVDTILQQADVVVTNLEAPLLDVCPQRLDGMIFCGVSSFASSMRRHNITVATLENNHILNYGRSGKEQTIEHLMRNSILPVVAREPQIVEKKQVKIGFVAVNGVGGSINIDSVREDIERIRSGADVVAVSVHWGREYSYIPMRAAGIAPDDPIHIAHALIDAGADLVIGNHPHWVQGVELYKHGFITYAHGNFIFDQEWSQETKEGVIGSYVFRNKKLVDVSFIPLVITDYAQPRLATESESEKILNAMKKSSTSIAVF